MPASAPLIRRRAVIKAKLTRIEKYVDEFDPNKNNINELSTRLELLEVTLKDFEKAQLDIELAADDESELEIHDKEREVFETRYCTVVSEIKTFIKKTIRKEQSQTGLAGSIKHINSQISRSALILRETLSNIGIVVLFKQASTCVQIFESKFRDKQQAGHYINQCTEFTNLNINERLKAVDRLRLCKNCLRGNHATVDCKSKSRCKNCNLNHNTLIHGANDQQTSTVQQSESVSLNSYSDINTLKSGILSTAIILIMDKKGQYQECRAFLDSDSMNQFITSDMCKKLGLTRQKIEIQIGGIPGHKCLMLDRITENLPVSSVNLANITVPKNIKLADPQFYSSAPIDLLIGAELLVPLMCIGQIHLAPGQPHFQKTHLGWILGGTINLTNNKTKALCHLSHLGTELQEQVTKFLNIEHVRVIADKLSPEERQCETHFRDTVKRDSQGRFIVRLPFNNSPPDLGDSKQGTVKRFRSLENKFAKQLEFKEQYSDFIKEYIKMDHMELVNNPNLKDGMFCYLPHHAVLKLSSSTTKLRAVFDASFCTNNGKSLNDNLMCGPVIQDDLFAILTRFRIHRYVITADIAKMYRQILVDPADRDYQLILWRAHSNEELNTYQLKTLTYDTKPASFIATRCLSELAAQNQDAYPAASTIIGRDFYMDDLLTGSETVSDLITIRDSVSAILQQGGFELRKWASNAPESLPNLNTKPKQNSIINLDNDNNLTKTLGLFWDSKNDWLKYEVQTVNVKSRITKRVILSTIAQIFDPLGIIGPVMLKAKLVLQNLWSLKIGWDESVPQDIHCAWVNFINELSYLRELRIPRRISDLSKISALELHGFCDASIKGYGAAVYVRTYNGSNKHSVYLLCSKSRVAPLKTVTLPRLELCGALLLARLISAVRQALKNVNITKQYLWSDSRVTIA
ncbi:uncharacterized protein LOC135131590 [Zophobas morio]|uniref:uncharacterized protein LOC135131590 n=1 Tax=Zophobas morio TaxID=2755281 RepID=UPI003082868D